MIADGAEFNRRYRTIIFDIGVTFGLWALVATGIYVANEAERAYLDRLSVVGDNAIAAGDDAEMQPRDKDDRYTFVVVPDDGHVAMLPPARPIRVQDSAGQPRRQTYSAGAVPPRNEPFEAAGAERFDRCAPLCESRDPLIARAAVTPEVYRSHATLSSASQAPTDEHVVLHLGREIVDQLVDLPRATLDTGRQALESMVQMVQ